MRLTEDQHRALIARTSQPKPTGIKKMQALGRLKTGVMNNTEKAYAAHLANRLHLGGIAWYQFEGIKFRLADNTFYSPDFAVMLSDGRMEIHEVKGFMTDDANVKIKIAASMFPFKFLLIRKKKGDEWDIQEI